MVDIVRAEEEEEGELAVSDFLRPSSPWKSSVVAQVESMLDYDYDAYFSQRSNVNFIRSPSPDPFSVPFPSLCPWDFRDTPIPTSPSPSPSPSPYYDRITSCVVVGSDMNDPFLPANDSIMVVNILVNSFDVKLLMSRSWLSMGMKFQIMTTACQTSIGNWLNSNGYTKDWRDQLILAVQHHDEDSESDYCLS